MSPADAARIVADHAKAVGPDAPTPFLLPVFDYIPPHTCGYFGGKDSTYECAACRWVSAVSSAAMNLLDQETTS